MYYSLKTTLILLGVILFLIISGVGYIYYSQNRIESLKADISQLTLSLKSSEDAINKIESEYEKVRQQLRKVNREIQETVREERNLQERFDNNRLSDISKEKPALVEKLINSASEKANRCIELLTGAPLTEEELNAKDAKSFNSECPYLFNRLVRP